MAITDILVAHNRQFTPTRPRLPLQLAVRDAADRIVGGALGYIQHDWCYVDILTLSADQRGAGNGARLLAAIEAQARSHHCMGVYLFSYTFQAPGFYERLGYREFGRLNDLPPGHARVYLVKRF